ncbi:hypothetical protein C0J08_09375 [Marinomonas sp. CT5]|uniref:hypothetical protein n=1 Tax=Marinomonas sp. CT5 TaxID=2066133 RepID=UPI001BAF26FE|nr:hypothetical protein [Marinomonas sp. CT5]QUX95611.1 hypothetical protein C0J08_09375 [Marinomonas sp. CT5]
MSGSLRYKDPIICDYLASQYVMSVPTPHVKARIEYLRQQIPELDDAIINWSESVANIHKQIPGKQPSVKVWKNIDNSITQPSYKTKHPTAGSSSWWNNLLFWRLTGIGASVASLGLALVLSVDIQKANVIAPLISSAPSYTAVMSPINDGIKNSDDIRFVVNVYRKTETKPSRLFIQWSERKPRMNMTEMHVWAQEQATGKMAYIGVETNGAQSLSLNKATWTAVSNSSHLIFTTDTNKPNSENTLFSGPCIQLSSWKKNSI